jgi:YVTN family beta-propeller protein
MDMDLRPGWRRLRGAKRPGAPREPALVSPAGVPAPALASIFVGGDPAGVAITPDGSQAYVTNARGGTVSVIDTGTATVSATVAVGTGPVGVAITPDGSHAYVTTSEGEPTAGTVSVIDTATDTVSATITLGSPSFGVAITADGIGAYVTNADLGTVSLIDATTNTVSASVTVGIVPVGVAITPDGSAYVANSGSDTVSVIDATATVSATIAVGSGPFGVAITTDGSQAYVTNFDAGTVSVIDTATNTVSATIAVGSGPAGVAITPDGSQAYVTNFDAGTVSVIDTVTNTVSATIAVGSGPFGVAITPDGSHAYVTNSDAGTVSVIPMRPAVTTISPTQGPTTGGTVVRITGTSLDEVTTVVNFGPDLATNLFLNAAGTQLRATSPGGAGNVPVTVTTSGGTSNALPFSYLPPAPALTGFAPDQGPKVGSTQVTISGTNLGGATAVSFGHGSATGVLFNPAGTEVLATAPPGLGVTPGGVGRVPVTVTTPGGTSNAVDFTYR